MKVRTALILALVLTVVLVTPLAAEAQRASTIARIGEYAPLVKLRQGGSDLDLVAVEACNAV